MLASPQGAKKKPAEARAELLKPSSKGTASSGMFGKFFMLFYNQEADESFRVVAQI
jgi:hypothetical protein